MPRGQLWSRRHLGRQGSGEEANETRWAQPRERRGVQTTVGRETEAHGAGYLASETDPGRQRSQGDPEGQERGKSLESQGPSVARSPTCLLRVPTQLASRSPGSLFDPGVSPTKL